MSKPARNATGKEAPGQIVFSPEAPNTESFNRYEFLEKPIIKEKKMTFEEWYADLMRRDGHNAHYYKKELCRFVWKSAQENM